MEVREYHYWHERRSDLTWHKVKGRVITLCVCACVRTTQSMILLKLCTHGPLRYDESLSFLWSISLWSVITIPSRHSCSLKHKCCSLTNAVWFGWKMNVSINIACPCLKCIHQNQPVLALCCTALVNKSILIFSCCLHQLKLLSLIKLL